VSASVIDPIVALQLRRGFSVQCQPGAPARAAVDVLASAPHDGTEIDLDVTERVRQAAAGSEQLDAVVHTAWEVDQLLESRRPNAALDWRAVTMMPSEYSPGVPAAAMSHRLGVRGAR
jgi:hypothetical protein